MTYESAFGKALTGPAAYAVKGDGELHLLRANRESDYDCSETNTSGLPVTERPNQAKAGTGLPQ